MGHLYEITTPKGKKSYIYATSIYHEDASIPSQVIELFECARIRLLERPQPNRDGFGMLQMAGCASQRQSQHSQFEALLAPGGDSRIAYLLTVEEQENAVWGLHFTDEEKLEFDNYIKRNVDRIRFASIEEQQQAYREDDFVKIYTQRRPIFPEALPEIVKRFYRMASVETNNYLVNTMQPELEKGNAFVAIDAGVMVLVINFLHRNHYQIKPVPFDAVIEDLDHSVLDSQKIAAFRKIYEALYEGQTSFFKTRGFYKDPSMSLSLELIEDYACQHPSSRTATAWALAQKHYRNATATNAELFKAIHRYAHANSSSFGFFKRSENFADDNYLNLAQKIANAREGSRSYCIALELK